MSLLIATTVGFCLICSFKDRVRWHEPKQMNHYGDHDMADAYRSAFKERNITIQTKF